MIPIQKLLSRIRWDTDFGKGSFEFEFEDRITGLTKMPLERITAIGPLSFSISDEQDRTITIPLHRIKRVYRNGELLWSRIKTGESQGDQEV